MIRKEKNSPPIFIMKIFLKKYHKNKRHLRLVAHIVTKLSQNVYLINTHILIYRYARCNCKLCKFLWFCCVFLAFSYIIDDHSCLNCLICAKLSHILCPIDTHILACQNAKFNCKLWQVLWFNTFFGEIFVYYYMFEKL